VSGLQLRAVPWVSEESPNDEGMPSIMGLAGGKTQEGSY